MTSQEFKQRFLPHHKLLYRVAFKLEGNAQDAEDLLQDLYLKLWTKRESLPDDAQTEAYLVRMMKNLFYDKRRRKQIDTQAELEEEKSSEESHSLEHEIEQREEALKMQVLINKLPDKQRQIIEMHAIEDKSYEEIERYTGLSSGNIRLIVMRTRQKLKEQFKKLTTDGRDKQ